MKHKCSILFLLKSNQFLEASQIVNQLVGNENTLSEIIENKTPSEVWSFLFLY